MVQIQKALGADSLKPDEAKLAGRLSSSARRSSAGSGRPPLRRSTPERRTRQTPLHPLLPRRHGRGGALRGRLLPGRREDTQGGTRAGDGGRSRPNRANNGWGFVLRLGGAVFFDHGVVPPWFLQKFASRRAFIYMLEIFAQMVAFAAFSVEGQCGRRMPTRSPATTLAVLGARAGPKSIPRRPRSCTSWPGQSKPGLRGGCCGGRLALLLYLLVC